MKVDLTVAAVPAFIGAMGAEALWQRAHPVEPGTRAGDYQLADTLASLTMGVGSLLAPYVAKRVLDPVTPGVGRHGRTLLAVGAATALLTTVGDVCRRRVRDGRLPDPQSVPNDVRAVQDELAEIRLGPAVAPPGRAPLSPALRKAHAGLAVSAVASTALVTSTTWAALASGKRLFARSPLDLGTSPWAWAAAILGLGLHLLLEPPRQPREPLALGGARGAPLQRALQPVDGAAPAGGRGRDADPALRPARAGRRTAPADRAGPRHQPDLPVLDPHRGDPAARLGREGLQHPVAPPGAPRVEPRSTSTATTAAS